MMMVMMMMILYFYSLIAACNDIRITLLHSGSDIYVCGMKNKILIHILHEELYNRANRTIKPKG